MIELKSQLQILTYPDGLKNFVGQQTERRVSVKTAVEAATAAVAKARAAIVIPVIGETKRIGTTNVTLRTGEDVRLQAAARSHAERQTVKIIAEIGADLDKVVVPIIKQMHVASNTAKEFAVRHFDKYSIFRRAKGAANGLMEAMQLRAFYTTILTDIEPRELAAFAQQAIDTGDPILADVVQRENFTRARDRRGFINQTLLDLVPNAEFDSAQVMLATVTQFYEQATIQYATFGRETGAVKLQRMVYGLNYGAATLDEDGSINLQGGK